MSVDILETSCDQCRSMVQYSFTSTESRRLVRTDTSTLTQPLIFFDFFLIFYFILFFWSRLFGDWRDMEPIRRCCTVCVSTEIWNRGYQEGANSWAQVFRSKAEMPSGPVAFLVRRCSNKNVGYLIHWRKKNQLHQKNPCLLSLAPA